MDVMNTLHANIAAAMIKLQMINIARKLSIEHCSKAPPQICGYPLKEVSMIYPYKLKYS
jgi:hypothetical protein